MRRKRLLWQLYPSYVLITLISLAAVTWYASFALRRFYREQMAADLEDRARLLERFVRPLLLARQYDQVDALCKNLGRHSPTRITVILDSDLNDLDTHEPGDVVGDSEERPANMDNHGGREEIVNARAGLVEHSERFSYTLKQDMMYVAIPIYRDDQADGQGRPPMAFLRTSVFAASIDEALKTIQLRIALGGLVVAILAAAVSLVVSRRISGPLEHLRRGAERFTGGELTHKLPVEGSREIAALAETLNQMAAELDDRIRTLLGERNQREAILASMAEGVLAVDSQQRVTSLNQAAASLLRVDPRQAEGRTLQEIVRNPKLHALVAGVLGGGGRGEAEIALRDAGERLLHVHGSVLSGPQGEGVGVLLVLHDVTRLKWLENVRRDFVANVSHELRTPITSIKGFVETLLEDGLQNAEDSERFLRIVGAQAERLHEIIEDLLTLSRIEEEAGKAEIARQPTRVRDVLEEAIGVCQLKSLEKHVRVELDCDGQLEANLNAALMEQAVVNLVDNAVKYSPEGQAVYVEAARAGAEVVIRVRDHGCGIGREHLARIFERFYRVDKARSRKLGGTGLGLAIVKHIAQAHGGRATVDSTVGAGSTFSIHVAD